jgi:hypothetical protein
VFAAAGTTGDAVPPYDSEHSRRTIRPVRVPLNRSGNIPSSAKLAAVFRNLPRLPRARPISRCQSAAGHVRDALSLLRIASRPRGAPEPTAETQAFVAASRRGTTRRRNILTGSLAAGLVVALALAGLAYWQFFGRALLHPMSAAGSRYKLSGTMPIKNVKCPWVNNSSAASRSLIPRTT